MVAAEATALDYLEWNGFDPAAPEVTAVVSTSYLGDVDKIEVVVHRSRAWLFGGLFGLGGGGQFLDVVDPADLNATFDQIGELLNYALIG